MDKDKIMATIRELKDIERAREEGKEEEVRDLTSQESFLLQCWQNISFGRLPATVERLALFISCTRSRTFGTS